MPVQVPGHVSDACMAVALYQHCLSWLNLSVECWDMPNVLLVKTEAVGVPEQVLLAGLIMTLTQLHYGNNGRGSSGGRPVAVVAGGHAVRLRDPLCACIAASGRRRSCAGCTRCCMHAASYEQDRIFRQRVVNFSGSLKARLVMQRHLEPRCHTLHPHMVPQLYCAP